MTIQQKIIEYLENNNGYDWVVKGDILRYASRELINYNGTIEREMRRMAEKGIIESEKFMVNKKLLVHYKLPQDHQKDYSGLPQKLVDIIKQKDEYLRNLESKPVNSLF